MTLTQTHINDAAMIGKSAAFRLANELALDVKYGGKIGCCVCNLKLLWLWTNTLSCITITEGVLSGCLEEDKVKSIIEKLRSMCTIINNEN